MSILFSKHKPRIALRFMRAALACHQKDILRFKQNTRPDAACRLRAEKKKSRPALGGFSFRLRTAS
jgi:hypothetical protein